MNRPASVNSRRCEKCAVGYITVDVYEEALCLNCGSRPRGWALLETRKYADNRHAVPGERWEEETGLNERQYIVPGAGGLGEIINNSFV